MSIRVHPCSVVVLSPNRCSAPPVRGVLSRFDSRRPRPHAAFSLIEVLIVVALLSVIVLGLMAMFGQTQRAFRLGMTQTDVLESGRATTDQITRELQGLRPSNVSGAANFYAWIPPFVPLNQELPGLDSANEKQFRTNVLTDLFFLTSENERWTAIGYRIGSPAGGMGTLYRYQRSGLLPADLALELNRFNNANLTDLSRMAEGVVHFRVRAYDTNGYWIAPPLGASSPYRYKPEIIADVPRLGTEDVSWYAFHSNAVPAAVEIELGFLEQRTLERAKALVNDAARRNFLSNRAGQVHLFRQKISIPTVDVKAYQ